MKTVKKTGLAFIVTFLLTFMLFIFGPAEIFFANVTEFEFVYGEFAGRLVLIAFVVTAIITAILALLPEKLYGFFISIEFGVAVAGYLQVMFLNKNLDLLGLNPEGYQIGVERKIGNAIVWLLIILITVIVSFIKYDIWKKVVTYISAFLLCIQLVALVSLVATAKDEAYRYPEGSWYLSGENQYVVSAEENVIVIILDYFSNQYLPKLEAQYPGATDFLNDFTYYSNVDCTYFGTFPSLPHMLTGQEVDMGMPINEWCAGIWQCDETVRFYDEVHEKNYVTNIYTPDTNILCGLNDKSLLDGKFSNLVNSSQEIEVSYELLVKTMIKMSCYRMFPELAKPYFYTNMNEYADVVTAKENSISHNNYDFYEGLLTEGLRVDEKSNYYIVQHLMGPHIWDTNENGFYEENSTLEETAKGCMVIVEEYLNQLKELGVYDDATIIITADHGGGYDSQVIFYMKQPGETHEEGQVVNAPVSFREFLPTIANSIGIDASAYGETIYDFEEDGLRERTVWLRWMDPAYPTVPCYTGDKDGSANVYYGYTYIGNIEDLLKQTQEGPSVVVPIVDSYF